MEYRIKALYCAFFVGLDNMRNVENKSNNYMMKSFKISVFVYMLCYFSLPVYASEKDVELNCEERMYLAMSFPDVLNICKPLSEKGNSYASLMVSIGYINNIGKPEYKNQGVKMLNHALVSNVDEAKYWKGKLIYQGVLEETNAELSLTYLKDVKGASKVSALTAMAVIYAEGKLITGINNDAAKTKFIEAYKVISSRLFEFKKNETDNKNSIVKLKKGKNYYLEKGHLADSIELVMAIKKYKFNLDEIRELAGVKKRY